MTLPAANSNTVAPMEINWDLLLENIYNHKCVLLLGPSMPYYRRGYKGMEKIKTKISLLDNLARLLGKELRLLSKERRMLGKDLTNEEKEKEKEKEYDTEQSGNPIYIIRKYIEVACVQEYKDPEEIFLNKLRSLHSELMDNLPSFYTKLTALPFNTIINTSPDNILLENGRNKGFESVDSFYNYSNNTDAKESVGHKDYHNKVKLIYNICGSITEKTSLILSEQERVRFYSDSTRKHLPAYLHARLDDEKSYIFLDFDFNDWQFKLLHELIDPKFKINPATKKNANMLYWPYLRHKNPKRSDLRYFQKRFSLDYVDYKTEDFIDDLFIRYEQKFGDPRRRYKIFVASDNNANDHEKTLIELLQWVMTDSRAEIITKSTVGPGGLREDIAKLFDEADVYIPLLSVAFVTDQDLRKQLERGMTQAMQGKKKIMPLIVSGGDVLGNLIQKLRDIPGSEILPYDANGNNTPLVQILDPQGKNKDEKFADIVKLINSQVK